MSQAGPEFYDTADVFATYEQHRQRADTPNDALEWPAVRALLGNLAGRRVVDLGCGDAAVGRYVLAHGAAAYHGLDGATRMVAAARAQLAGTAGTVARQTIEAWQPPAASCDLVISRLALHYVADLAAVLATAYRALVPGGRLIYSVEHPVITASAGGWRGGPRTTWLVDDYFRPGARDTAWLGGEVRKYHRTLEAQLMALLATGFRLAAVREGTPDPAHFADPTEHERRRRIPLLLIVAGDKPAPTE